MSALAEYTTKCEVCGKEIKTFTGLDNWAIMEKNYIKSLCKVCSGYVKQYVKFLKGSIGKK